MKVLFGNTFPMELFIGNFQRHYERNAVKSYTLILVWQNDAEFSTEFSIGKHISKRIIRQKILLGNFF